MHPHTPMPETVSPGSTVVDAILISALLTPLAGGMLPDDYGADSDHLVLWLDIRVEDLFGPQNDIDVPKPRRLKPHNPQIRNRYLDLFTDLADEKCLKERAFSIKSQVYGGMSEEVAAELESFMKDRAQCMMLAEEK